MEMNKKIHVGLLFGGRSGEHQVSIASALSVYQALDKSRYDVTMIAIDREGRWLLPNPATLLAQANDPMKIQIEKSDSFIAPIPFANSKQMVSISKSNQNLSNVDVIVPILHGTYGEDGTVQGLLEMAQIPYVGSGVLGSAIGMDKDISRKLLSAAGIRTVPTLAIRKSDYASNPSKILKQIESQFQYPLFVKPANAGSSVGVHKVKSGEGLAAAIADAFMFDVKVLVEKGVTVRELECTVLGNDNPQVSIVGECIPRHEFYSYEAKYLDENGVELVAPAENISQETVMQIQAWAILAFKTLECRGMARVDFFLDKNSGELYLNEINTIPGFTKVSMYPRMWAASGLPYSKLLDELIQLALENFEQRRVLKTTYDEK